MRARDIPLDWSRGSDWLLTTGLWRDALCAFPALRRFEATVWQSAYASMKNAQAQVWKGKHRPIPTKNWFRVSTQNSHCSVQDPVPRYTTNHSMVQLEPIACVTASCRKPHRRSNKGHGIDLHRDNRGILYDTADATDQGWSHANSAITAWCIVKQHADKPMHIYVGIYIRRHR